MKSGGANSPALQPGVTWATLLGFCAVACFGVAVLFSTLFAGAAVALSMSPSAESEQADKSGQPRPEAAPEKRDAPASASYSGMVSDSHCMGRHVRYPDKSPAECAKMCARSGSAYVLVDGDRKYVLQGGDLALDKVAAQRAVITGTLAGDTVKVASVTLE